jgi:hypothetical protein
MNDPGFRNGQLGVKSPGDRRGAGVNRRADLVIATWVAEQAPQGLRRLKRFTFLIGVAGCHASDSVGEGMQAPDAALYEAKRHRRDRISITRILDLWFLAFQADVNPQCGPHMQF